MGWKFRKSIKIAPGIKLNFNKNSTGVTFGGKGVHYTVNSKGKRTKSIGIPGTGLYYSTTSTKKANNKKSKTKNAVADKNSYSFENERNVIMNDTKWYAKSWFIILMLIVFFPAGIFLM